MQHLKDFLIVGAGGALGAAGRYAAAIMLGGLSLKHGVPYATLAVNVAGSFLIGFFALHAQQNHFLKLFLLVGILGGFTTFSSFSHETLALYHSGAFLKAALNVILNVTLCLLGVFCGFEAAKLLS